MIRESFDWKFILAALPRLLRVLPVTLGIAAAAAVLGCLAGLALTFGKVSRHRLLRGGVDLATNLLRGVPTVVLLYLVYFGLPFLVQRLTGADISAWAKQVFVVIALGLELAVTCSEMFRSAYNSLDKGQLEAAHALGMTNVQRFFRVTLPQGVYVILPNLGSAVLALVQGTSLAYTLGLMDVMGRAKMLDTNAMNMKTFEAFLAAGLIYWGISIVTGQLFRLLERRFGRGMKTVAAGKGGNI